MKALSRKRKRVVNVGRPRKEGVERYKCGKIKPEENEREAKSVVMAYRVAQFGVDEEDAGSDLAGSALGRLYLSKDITKGQYNAGLRYCDDMFRYYSFYLGTPPTVQAQNLFKVRGFSPEINAGAEERGRKASNTMAQLVTVLAVGDPQVRTLVNKVCIEDEDARHWPVHMLGWLRQGLKALVVHYGVEDGQV